MVILAFLFGVTVAMGMALAVIILGLQQFTTFPLRRGWRQHHPPIGKQLANGDPRLDPGPRRLAYRGATSVSGVPLISVRHDAREW